MKKKAEVVFIPSPGVGHLVSTLEFAKLLVNRDDRLQITVLVIKFSPTSDTDAYTDPIASERLRVINLPEPHIVPSTSDRGSTTATLLESQKPHVREAVSNLTATGGGSLAAFVVDMFCTTMIEVAREFRVPSLVFFTSGAALLGLMLHLHTLKERDSTAELQDELAIPCFANPVPSNTLPSVVLRKEWEQFFMRYGRGLKEANGFIVNSFEELESHAVHSFSDPALSLGLPLYPVGPILNPEPKMDKGTADDILKWLDDQPPSSVVFLCFGSRGAFDEEQVTEIARALEDSGARFLWSLRKPPPNGTMAEPPSDYPLPELAAVLPEGFLDRTAGIGRVIGWAPQAQVLAHPATGGFVSHCGWNSILESIYFGVPIATWPLFAEQQTNAFQLVRELKMAVEIALDYRVEMDEGRNFLLTADRIERGIRSVLDKDGEIRKKVKEMSEKSRKTLLEGGCSYTHLTRLIDYIMEQV
uniref:Glycosyltransferase n=1 Tax=Glycyrrhiza uralensis TaxID=74613 RepID=A0A515L4B4_GLYUR|nr:UDP-glycosyltransferase UGT71S4 [Glycyrrhiza uralensis]